jgi:hypothetical protein
MQAEAGTVVLFQYERALVASAQLLGIERYASAKSIEGMPFRGAYLFDPSSIRTFDPVDSATLRRFWPQFERFGQAKQKLSPPSNYARFRRSLRHVRSIGRHSR